MTDTSDVARIVSALDSWADALAGTGRISRSFVFGSLVNKDGKQFEMGVNSDIDLVLVFSAASEVDAHSRTAAAQEVRAKLVELERDLFYLLKLRFVSPLVSCTLLTSTEIKRCLHKDVRPELLSVARFRELGNGKAAKLVAISETADPQFAYLNSEAATAMAFAQKKRNDFLRTNVHGDSFLDVASSTDPVTKDLLRTAALIAYASKKDGARDVLSREDTLEGLEYLTVLLNERRQAGGSVDGLRDWLAVQRNARGKGRSLAADEYLLLCELLFDRALTVLRPTALDAAAEAVGMLEDE